MNVAGDILSAIPHRPPFLFVDRVVELSPNRIVTETLADPAADFFRGHYPGEPLMPGVLLCECCFQSGAILISHHVGGWNAADGVPVLTRIGDARFKHVVRPGDMLRAEVTLDDELDRAYFLTGRLMVDGKSALRVTFSCMLAHPQERSA